MNQCFINQHPTNSHLNTKTHQVAVSDLLNITTDQSAFKPTTKPTTNQPKTDTLNLANNPLFAQPRITNALTLMTQLHTHKLHAHQLHAHHCQSFDLPADKKSIQIHAHTLLLGTHGMGKSAFIKAWLRTHANHCPPLSFVVFIDTQSPFTIHHLPITHKTHLSLQQNLNKFWQHLSVYPSQDDPAHTPLADDAIFICLKTLAEALPTPSWQRFIKTMQQSIEHSPMMANAMPKTEQIKQRFFIYLSPLTEHSPPIHTAQPATPLDVLGGVILPSISQPSINQPSTSQHTVNDINSLTDMNATRLPHSPYMTHCHTNCHAYWHMGKLLQSQGGFLLIRLVDLLAQPSLRQGLYDVLTTERLPINYHTATYPHRLAYPTAPQTLPMTVTLIAIGEADEFDELCEIDPSFARLFTVRAEFDDTVSQTTAHKNGFAQLVYQQLNALNIHQHTVNDAQSTPISTMATDAIWQLYRHFVRLSGHNRLLVHMDKLYHLIQASLMTTLTTTLTTTNHDNSRFNQTKNTPQIQADNVIEAHDVIEAIRAQAQQADYLKSLYWQDIIQGQQNLNTQGWLIGRINALTVIDHANTQFGMPIQLTAVIEPHVGHGDIIDIEREVELGGDLHAKGMLIMSHFLKSTFSPFCPLNFSASLAVEQNYGEIDGDSATLAQACALLSSLGQIAIYQGIAVTGSMNQMGDVQAVGGINEKIESFFDLCQQQSASVNHRPTADNLLIQDGMNSTDIIQGVIIPKANITDLMLDDRVIHAVSTGQFVIHAVSHISEAMTLLTQMPYSNTNKKGNLSKHCLQGRIIKQLKQWQDDERG